MGKLLDALNKQLKSEHKQDAEDSLKIYNYLKDNHKGRVWESNWNSLIQTKFEGIYPNNVRISKPNAIGRLVLKGLE